MLHERFNSTLYKFENRVFGGTGVTRMQNIKLKKSRAVNISGHNILTTLQHRHYGIIQAATATATGND